MCYAKFYVKGNCQQNISMNSENVTLNRDKPANLTTKQHEIPATDRIIRFITIALTGDLRQRINEGRLNKKWYHLREQVSLQKVLSKLCNAGCVISTTKKSFDSHQPIAAMWMCKSRRLIKRLGVRESRPHSFKGNDRINKRLGQRATFAMKIDGWILTLRVIDSKKQDHCLIH